MTRIIIDRIRAIKPVASLPDSVPGPDDKNVVHDPELYGCLDELRERSERAADVVWLRFVLGLTVEQSVRVLGCSERTVKSDWSFGRAFLHRCMEQRGSL